MTLHVNRGVIQISRIWYVPYNPFGWDAIHLFLTRSQWRKCTTLIIDWILNEHGVLINSSKSSVLSSNVQMLKLWNYLVDGAFKLVVYWARPLVNSFRKWYFQQITRSCPTIGMLINRINRNIQNIPFDMTERAVKILQLFSLFIEIPDLDRILMHCHKLIWISIKPRNIITILILMLACRLKYFRLSFIHVPHYELAPIQMSSDWCEQSFIAIERQSFYLLLMIFDSVENFHLLEVPNNQRCQLLRLTILCLSRTD